MAVIFKINKLKTYFATHRPNFFRFLLRRKQLEEVESFCQEQNCDLCPIEEWCNYYPKILEWFDRM